MRISVKPLTTKQTAGLLIFVLLIAANIAVKQFSVNAGELILGGAASPRAQDPEAVAQAHELLAEELNALGDTYIDKDTFLSRLGSFAEANGLTVIQFSENAIADAVEGNEEESPVPASYPMESTAFKITLRGQTVALHRALKSFEELNPVYRLSAVQWQSESVSGIAAAGNILEQLANPQFIESNKIQSLNSDTATMSFVIEYFYREEGGADD